LADFRQEFSVFLRSIRAYLSSKTEALKSLAFEDRAIYNFNAINSTPVIFPNIAAARVESTPPHGLFFD